MPDECEQTQNIAKVRTKDTQSVQQFLGQNHVFFIALRQLGEKVRSPPSSSSFLSPEGMLRV
jgi:hypothetical protein